MGIRIQSASRRDACLINVAMNNPMMNSCLRYVSIAWCLLALGRSANGQDQTSLEEAAVRAAVQRIAPSVVRIETVGGLEKVGKVLIGEGPTTGLIVSSDGFVLSS